MNRFRYRDLLARLLKMTETELDEDVLVGTRCGFVAAKGVERASDATDAIDLDGTTHFIETAAK